METSIFESNTTVLSDLSSLIKCFYKHCTMIRSHLAEIPVCMSLVLAEKFLKCLSHEQKFSVPLFPVVKGCLFMAALYLQSLVYGRWEEVL